MSDTVQEARERLSRQVREYGILCVDAYRGLTREKNPLKSEAYRELMERVDALIAAARAEGRAEERARCVAVVKARTRWDMVGPEDSFNDDWIIAHDSEGEYLHRSDVLHFLTGADT